MIKITCTSCRTVLTIDDAFAGGVCRCQHCGTIQTVPKSVKSVARAAVPTRGAATGSKTLYQARAGTDAGTGLDDLASAVASSGLSSARLRDAQAQKVTASNQLAVKLKQNPVLWLAIAGVAAVAVGLCVWFFFRSSSPTANPQQPTPNIIGSTADNNTGPAGNPSALSQPNGPSFCGVLIAQPIVVYILDRGSGTGRNFDPAKAALYRSIQSLQPSQRFAVLLTDNKTPAINVPPQSVLSNSSSSMDQVHAALDNAVADGSTTFRSALSAAMIRKANVICLITGKYSLSQDDADALKECAQKNINLDIFQIGDTTSGGVMQDAASTSGGTYRVLSESDLRAFGS